MNFSWMLGLIILSQQVTMPGNLVITHNGHPISVANDTNFTMHLPFLAIIDTERFQKFMDEIDQQVTKNPKNAMIDINGNIIPEQVGYHLNREVFTEKIFSYYFNNTSSEFDVPLQTTFPMVDSELLENIRAKKIGEYVTFFSSNNKERNNNIYLAANAINNYVLFQVKHFPLIKWLVKDPQEKDICLPLSL